MSASLVNSTPTERAAPTFTGPPKGAVGIDTQQVIRFVKSLWKYVSPSRIRPCQSFWSTPASHDMLRSGWRSGLPKSGKKRSLKVGARKPVPALPRMRVPDPHRARAPGTCVKGVEPLDLAPLDVDLGEGRKVEVDTGVRGILEADIVLVA